MLELLGTTIQVLQSPTNTILEASTEVTDGAQESAMFDWFRYDTAPRVTSVSPDVEDFNQGTAISINATVIDKRQCFNRVC